MGERTQLIVKFNVKDNTSGRTVTGFSAYHYQWGIGRVMPMSVLNIVTKATYFSKYDLIDCGTDCNLDNLLLAIQNSVLNIISPIEHLDLLHDDWYINGYNQHKSEQAKKNILWPQVENYNQHIFSFPNCGHFDNDDGYMTLELNFCLADGWQLYLAGGQLKTYYKCFDSKKMCKERTFKSWCSEWTEFCSTGWQKGFSLLLKDYGIKMK